jgi:hypothetical protein
MTLMEIADLIGSSYAQVLACGNYKNRKGALGYFLQVKCGDHWCRISVSHIESHSDRITLEELNAMDSTRLLPANISIPIDSILKALRSAARCNVPVQKYLNSSDVEGVWAEFKEGGSWYMVSVSHVDVPKRAAPEILDRIADDLLWQQARLRPYPWK